MNFRQLEMFLAVVEGGGYAQAADALHVAHSAIHRQVRMLSEELGDPLLYRRGRETCLTAAGKVCLDLARRTAAEISKGKRQIREMNAGQGGALRIGTGPTLLCFFVLPILRRFLSKFPKVETYVMTAPTDVLLERLRDDQLDLGILTTPLGLNNGPDFSESESIYRDEYVLAFSDRHALAARSRITRPMLRDLAFIMPPTGTALRNMLDERLARAGVVPKVVMELDNQGAMRKMVQMDMGVALLPRLRPAGDGVRYCSFPGERIYREVVLVRPDIGYLPAAVRDFQELARGHARSLQGRAPACA